MFVSDRTMKLLLESGLPADKLVEIMQALRADEEAARPVDLQAERRRERDRDRKRLRNSAESAEKEEFHADPRPLPLSPQTPQTPTPTPGVNTTRARGFAEFWSAYPNKVGKRDAEKSYVAALKRVTGPDPPSLILDGVIRAQTSRKWLDGIIPNPATWLNQDRWEDQPSEVIPLQPRKAHERPHPDAKLIARHANYARAWEGSERAAGRDGKP